MLKSRRNLLSAIVVGAIAGAVAMPTFAADKKMAQFALSSDRLIS